MRIWSKRVISHLHGFVFLLIRLRVLIVLEARRQTLAMDVTAIRQSTHEKTDNNDKKSKKEAKRKRFKQQRNMTNAQHGRQKERRREVLPDPYLITIHFEFSHDLYGHLLHLRECILGSVDIAKGSVAHLLDEDISI